MWRMLPVFLLVGCSYQSGLTGISETRASSSAPASWLTPALNQQDIALLDSAFNPSHPLEDIDPIFAHDPSWRSLAKEWIADVVSHGDSGDWQLRKVVSSGDVSRYEYRLVHADFSVEYFYFDVTESNQGRRIEDIGNHLYHYSQVELMTQLYRRVVFVEAEEESGLGEFVQHLGNYNGGLIGTDEVIGAYLGAKPTIRHDRLVRELLLRALMSGPGDWMETTDIWLADQLLGDDYPLLSLMACMAHPDVDCQQRFNHLPPSLGGDVALVTEMGIRLLQDQHANEAIPYANRLMNAKVDYFPAYWLQLQVGIATSDYSASVTSLENLVERFELMVDKQLLTQVYPTLGQQFIESNQFKQWASRRAQQEFN